MKTNDELMFPVLQFFTDGQAHTRQDVFAYGTKHFGFTTEELTLRHQSGSLVYKTRIGWAIAGLALIKVLTDETRLLKRVARATYQITPLGEKLAKDETLFNQWFATHYGLKKAKKSLPDNEKAEEPTIDISPEEHLDQARKLLDDNLKSELLAEIMQNTPQFFERLVLKLLGKMGYGTEDFQCELTKNGADGGIDGIIYEDELGLSKIYLQAKRWQGVVGRPEIQKLVGAIADKNTKKGVFITTSNFTENARSYAQCLQSHSIALIDGEQLAALMIKYKIGVEVADVIEICRINGDFFEN